VVGIVAHLNTDEHTHVHCDPNRNTYCYADFNIYLPGVSPGASSGSLMIVDIMLVVAHWGRLVDEGTV
jgi:hypothetical protein